MPFGRSVTWRCPPVARSQAYSSYVPVAFDTNRERSGASSAQSGRDTRGARKRFSQSGIVRRSARPRRTRCSQSWPHTARPRRQSAGEVPSLWITSARTEPVAGQPPGCSCSHDRSAQTVESSGPPRGPRLDAFADTLAEDVVYTLPQTRERISGRERYVEFNREYPGDWHLRIERIVAEPGQVVTWIHFTWVRGDGRHLVLHRGESGRISVITDFWPEPYEPPAGRDHLTERY